MNANKPQEKTIKPIWQLAFRSGFLTAACFAIVAIGLWWFQLEQGFWYSSTYTPHWWHAHEMLLGFGLPVVIGFLLTAVQNWTGIPGTKGLLLQAMFSLWLLTRVILLLWPEQLVWALLAESSFIFIAVIELLRRLWPKRQWRNLPIVLVLCLLGVVNAMSYQQANMPSSSTQIHYALLWLFILLISVIAGRIIPFFSSQRLQTPQVQAVAWLEAIVLLSTLAIVVSLVLGQGLSSNLSRCLLGVAGVSHLYRWGRWQRSGVYGDSLLWSLHLCYLLLPLSCLLLALNFDTNTLKSSIHLLSIGVMSGIILAMMARVSLGHTGRPIKADKIMSLSFALILLAALIRGLLPLINPSYTFLSWQLSASAWLIAFGIFTVKYAPLLLSPRIDGKEG